MGGDEFLLFLPKVSIEETETIMSDLIEQFKGIVENDHEIHFATLSAGMLMTTKMIILKMLVQKQTKPYIM